MMASLDDHLSEQSVKAAAKRLITHLDPGAQIAADGVQFLVSDDSLPEYITSDNPVIHSMRHVDKVALLTGRPELSTSHSRNQEYPCWILPMTPHIALIASRFIRDGHSSFPYIRCSDEESVFMTNLLTLYNASEYIVAASPNPFGIHESRVSEVLQKGELPPAQRGTLLKLYTAGNRYWLRLNRFENIPDGIRFWTAETEKLRALLADRELVCLKLYEEGRQVREMRLIEIQRSDPTGEEATEICSKIRLERKH